MLRVLGHGRRCETGETSTHSEASYPPWSINLIRRFSGRDLGGSWALRLGGLWQSRFDQTLEADADTGAASAAETGGEQREADTRR